jgi:hypothetical protein
MADYEITRQRIIELNEGEEEGYDDYGFYKPTTYALETTLQLLDTLYERLGDRFPRGFCSTEYRGGVDLTFNSLKVKLIILVPPKPSEQYHIYIGSDPSQMVYYPTVDFIVETIQNNEN